jgi:hypothetical protein
MRSLEMWGVFSGTRRVMTGLSANSALAAADAMGLEPGITRPDRGLCEQELREERAYRRNPWQVWCKCPAQCDSCSAIVLD